MNDLISKLSEIRSNYNCFDEAEEPYYRALSEAIQLASAQPKIIRCKECKWCIELYDSFDGTPYWMCKNWDGETDTDGFCHEAKRRIYETD